MEREVEYKQHKAPKIVISSEEGDHVGVHRTFTDLELDGIRKTIEAAGKVNTNLRLLIGEYQAFRNKARIDNQGRTASGGSPVVAQHVPEAAHLNKEDQLIVLCQKLNDFRLDNKDWQYKCWKAESELRFQVKRNTKLINEVVGVEYGHASELNDLTQVFLARLNRIHWNWACFMLFVVLTLIIFGGHHG